MTDNGLPGARRLLTTLAAAALLPLMAGGTLAAGWDDVPTAAAKEGKVTIYTGTSHPIIDKEIAAFSAKYPGITFDVLDGEGPDLNARIDQEVASGTPIADMYISTDSAWIPDADGRGVLAPLTGPSAQAWPADFHTGNGYKISLIAGGIAYNTDLVKTPIKGYEDLVGDAFTGGKLGVQQWSNNVEPGFFKHLDRLYPGLVDKLGTQKPTIYRSSEAGAASVASGELAAVLFAVPAVPKNLIAQGAPIAWIIPDNPYGLAILVMVTKAAPHPNAAQLFADFLLSQDGQKIWNPDGSGQASPLGFGDFDAAKADLWAPAQWSKDDVAGQKATWDKRFGG